jgi:small subunit ribosomal protein S1
VSEEYREAFGEHAYDEHGNYIGYDYAGVGFTPETEAQAAWVEEAGKGPVAEETGEGPVETPVVEAPVAEEPGEGPVEAPVVEAPVVDTGEGAYLPEGAQRGEVPPLSAAGEASPQGPAPESLPPEG